MSKTVQAISELAVGVTLIALTAGAAAPAVAWGLTTAQIGALLSIGVSAGLTGVFGLLQPLLNPQDTSVPGSQQNAQESAAFRRVIYGAMEVGGVLTFDSAPAGDAAYQNQGAESNFRHQVYTIAAHQISAFGRGGIPMVVIDGILTQLVLDGSGYYVPANFTQPYGGKNYWHIGFEFDLGNPSETTAFPLLSAACPDWSASCVQRGRAKVHVAMRYDVQADGSQVGNTGAAGYSPQLQTSVPIFINGRQPTFRFPLVGKPIADTRMAAALTGWQPHTPFSYAEYVIDPNGNVEVQINGPQGSFTSGGGPVPWAARGGLARDGEALWLNCGPIQSGGWPGPGQTIATPYVFRDPNGNLQLMGAGGGVGSVTVTGPGSYPANGGVPTITDGGPENSGGTGATFGAVLLPIPNSGPPPTLYLWRVNVESPGIGYPSDFNLVITGGLGGGSGSEGSATAHPAPRTFTSGATQPGWSKAASEITPDNGQAWLTLGVPGSFAFATNPSNPALVIYDYLVNTEYGMAADPSSIDIASVNAAANICEELVTVNIASNGFLVNERLYDCNGLFDYSATRGDVLKSLLSSMAGTILPPGDMWHIFAGAYNFPTATLTDADLRDSIKADFRISRRDICNGVKGTFIPAFLPTNRTEAQPAAWRWTDFPPYQGNGLQGHPNYLAEDGGQIIWKEVRFGFTTSIWMAQRLAKITLQLLRFQVTLHLACKLTAFPVQAGDTITFVHKRWAALSPPPPTTFFVTQATLIVNNQDGVPALGVDLVLRETDPSIYQFAAPGSSTDQGEYSNYGTLGTF